jgi:hypothetical protein
MVEFRGWSPRRNHLEVVSRSHGIVRGAGLVAQARDSDEFARLGVTGLELIPPGVVLVSEWRAGSDGPLTWVLTLDGRRLAGSCLLLHPTAPPETRSEIDTPGWASTGGHGVICYVIESSLPVPLGNDSRLCSAREISSL